MTRHLTSRRLIAALAVVALTAVSCGSDDDSNDTASTSESADDTATTDATAATDDTATTAATSEEATPEATEAPTTEPAAMFDGELVGTFSIDDAVCDSADVTGSYFRMLQPDGNYIPNADSPCVDTTYSALTAGTDGGLVTGAYQPAPDPAFDEAGNGLADAIAAPVTFFAVKFAAATDPAEAMPTLSATDGVLSGDLSAFTAYYGGQSFNQGAPKPDGSGEAPMGTIDPETGVFVLDWTSLISGGSFDGFTGVWHLEGTFAPSS
jgi:hypothetical protein